MRRGSSGVIIVNMFISACSPSRLDLTAGPSPRTLVGVRFPDCLNSLSFDTSRFLLFVLASAASSRHCLSILDTCLLDSQDVIAERMSESGFRTIQQNNNKKKEKLYEY
jgi:hypothetical protein